MGYTHYFPQTRDLTPGEFAKIGEAVRAIIARSNVRIVREYDRADEPPEITPDLIAFNGPNDDGHETFWLDRTMQEAEPFLFCKTARKPYDVVVTATLIAMEEIAPGAFQIGSDGDRADWMGGLMLARESGLPNTTIPGGVEP